MTAGGNLDTGPLDPDQLDPILLTRAIEAARQSLRRMEDKDVPAKLRDVGNRSGKLPLPLLRRLLTELNSSEWLRAEAAEELGPEGEVAATLFLLRPDGWREELSRLVAKGSASVEASRSRKLEADLRMAVTKAARLSESLARSKQRELNAAEANREKLEAEAAKKERALAVQQKVVSRLRTEAADLRDKISALQSDNSDLMERLKALRAAHKKKSEAAATASGAALTGIGWSTPDALTMARHLDDVMAAATVPAKSTSAQTKLSKRSLLSLPPSVRPDKGEAIKWLLEQKDPLTVAIDGWNAAHQLKSPPEAAERDRVVEAARRVSIASGGRRTMLVVFDSAGGIESYSTKEVEVRYVPSADEELITLAHRQRRGQPNELANELVVITSDRRVRETVEADGAIGMWSEALIDWLNTSGRRSFGA